MRTLYYAPLSLILMSCEPSSTDGAFEGGDFQFQTTGVTDACYDGGFEVIFMPEGTANDFASAIYVPGDDELPAEYAIDLAEPFGTIQVTVTGADGARSIAGAQATAVELDADSYPGCLVDSAISVDLVVDSNDEVHGTAVLNTSSFDEDTCPAVDSDPCAITLDLRGTRN